MSATPNNHSDNVVIPVRLQKLSPLLPMGQYPSKQAIIAKLNELRPELATRRINFANWYTKSQLYEKLKDIHDEENEIRRQLRVQGRYESPIPDIDDEIYERLQIESPSQSIPRYVVDDYYSRDGRSNDGMIILPNPNPSNSASNLLLRPASPYDESREIAREEQKAIDRIASDMEQLNQIYTSQNRQVGQQGSNVIRLRNNARRQRNITHNAVGTVAQAANNSHQSSNRSMATIFTAGVIIVGGTAIFAATGGIPAVVGFIVGGSKAVAAGKAATVAVGGTKIMAAKAIALGASL